MPHYIYKGNRIELPDMSDLTKSDVYIVLISGKWEGHSKELRQEILSSILKRPLSELDFSKTQYGKPFIHSEPKLEFNVSHSHDIWGIAIGKIALGLDIEKKRQIRSKIRVAKRMFSDSLIKTINEDAHDIKFWEFWNQKEAFVKLNGKSIFTESNWEHPEEGYYFKSLNLAHPYIGHIATQTPITLHKIQL